LVVRWRRVARALAYKEEEEVREVVLFSKEKTRRSWWVQKK
jgi:hypothetical protein